MRVLQDRIKDIVPRYEGDGMDLVWPVKHPPRAVLETAAQRIRQAL